jgi:hypothetical protein
VCSNLDGVQEEVPRGYRADNEGICRRESSGGGSGSYVQPTPTPSPEETPVVLGASTTLPATGASGAENALMSMFLGMISGGGVLITSGIRKLKAIKA